MKRLLALLLIFFFQAEFFLTPADAATFWVNPASSGQHCSNSPTDPGTGNSSQTIAQGRACLLGGDTLYIKAGTYVEAIAAGVIPSGSTSYATATTIAAAAGETVTLRPSAGPTAVIEFNASQSWIIIGGLVLDAANLAVGMYSPTGSLDVGAEHIKVVDTEIKNATTQGGLSTGVLGFKNSWFLRVNIHHNGSDPQFDHGFYSTSSDTIVEDSLIHDNAAWGIHLFNSFGTYVRRNIIRRNKIYSNGSRGLMISIGQDNQAYNNEIYSNGSDGILDWSSAFNSAIYNNTIYNNVGACIAIDGSSSGSAQVKNNICKGNGSQIIDNGPGGFPTTYNSNLGTSAGTGIGVVGEPLFTNAPGGDFRLGLGSAAIGTGANLSASFATDFNGSTRTVPWDIGAIAYSPGITPTCPATPAIVASYSYNGVATDSSAYANNPNTVGSDITYVAGKYGQGIQFGGAEAILVSHSQSLWFCTAFSLEAWINPPTTLTDFRAILASDYNSQDGYALYAGSQYYAGDGIPIGGYCLGAGGCVVAVGTAVLPALTWTHIVETYDNTLASANNKLWINGVNVASADGQAVLGDWSGNLAIGGSVIGGSPFVEILPAGTKLDEVRLRNYAMSQAQIIASMNSTSTAPAEPTGFKASNPP